VRTPTRKAKDRTLVRFPRRRRRRVWLRLVVVLSVLGLSVGALAYLWTVREVRVVGTGRVSALEIHAAAGLMGGERMLLTDMDEVARRVARIPSIRSAEVHRTLPAIVEIRVVERVPVARLEGRPELVADADARVFEFPDGSLPMLAGWKARPEAEPGARLDRHSAAVLSQLGDLPGPLLEETARIEVATDVVVHVSSGPEIRLGRASDLAAKAAAGWAVLNDARSRGWSSSTSTPALPPHPSPGPRGWRPPLTRLRPGPRPVPPPPPVPDPGPRRRAPQGRPGCTSG
jgi:cell division protein FtsQ